MAVVEQLIRAEADGSISFGNYKLPEKKKLENFEHNGDILKVKTVASERDIIAIGAAGTSTATLPCARSTWSISTPFSRRSFAPVLVS